MSAKVAIVEDDQAISQMYRIKFGELRTINKKNFVFWNDTEVEQFRKRIESTDIQVVAAATPLFKWYVHNSDPDVEHDNFGFNPRISHQQKLDTIKRTIDTASKLSIPRLRIFSGLGVSDNIKNDFSIADLLGFALEEAARSNIKLYLENEPACIVHNKTQITEVFASNSHPNFKFWLDIANLAELNEVIDDEFLESISNRIGYIHIKDYKMSAGKKTYVPVGKGEINFKKILSRVFSLAKSELIVTVETHAKTNKIVSSVQSINGTKAILNTLGVNYV